MKKLIFSMLVTCCLWTGPNCFAQIFISFDGVEGESAIPSFKGATEISSFSGGISTTMTMSSATAGAGAGKVKMDEFNFTKLRGKSSAALQMAHFTGKTIPKVEIRFYNPGDKVNHYLSIMLESVMVTNWKISGSGSEKLTESFTLAAGKIKTEENGGTNPDGSVKKNIAGWDVLKNMPNN
ncbi:MAG: type VI secretion system tube protein Hcp [Ferruginibacter sp.]|nr:type VI secretion system tube protein Hcp [Chitinophagaceae bacterium]